MGLCIHLLLFLFPYYTCTSPSPPFTSSFETSFCLWMTESFVYIPFATFFSSSFIYFLPSSSLFWTFHLSPLYKNYIIFAWQLTLIYPIYDINSIWCMGICFWNGEGSLFLLFFSFCNAWIGLIFLFLIDRSSILFSSWSFLGLIYWVISSPFLLGINFFLSRIDIFIFISLFPYF